MKTQSRMKMFSKDRAAIDRMNHVVYLFQFKGAGGRPYESEYGEAGSRSSSLLRSTDSQSRDALGQIICGRR